MPLSLIMSIWCTLCDSGDVLEGKLSVRELLKLYTMSHDAHHELRKTLHAVHTHFQGTERTRWGQRSSLVPRGWIAIDGAPSQLRLPWPLNSR